MLKLRALCAALFALACALPAAAHDVTVAVAANFTDPGQGHRRRLQKENRQSRGHELRASGGFLAQIENGAPFEVFLSADSDRPARLEADGYGVKDTRFVYAYGGVVLWSATPGRDVSDMLAKGDFEHLAIADPVAAPYGTAAVETLNKLGLYDATAPENRQGHLDRPGLQLRRQRFGRSRLYCPVADLQDAARFAMGRAER